MPRTRVLRPTASYSTDAILVGDPGRALLLAQELLEKPKMSNHARGLWGYSGARGGGGADLTIQSTGIGGPSATLVLDDLIGLGVRRVIRVGSATAAEPDLGAGELIVVEEAFPGAEFNWLPALSEGGPVQPDPDLSSALRLRLPTSGGGRVVSLAMMPEPGAEQLTGFRAGDMQTAALLARAAEAGIAAAAVLIAFEGPSFERIGEEPREEAERLAGRAASAVLSSSR